MAVNIPEGEVENPTSIPARSADGRETSGNMPERGGGVPDLRSGPVQPWELAVPIALVGGQGDVVVWVYGSNLVGRKHTGGGVEAPDPRSVVVLRSLCHE